MKWSLFNYDSHDRFITWIDLFGNPTKSSNEIAAAHKKVRLVEEGEACGKLKDLVFRERSSFMAWELHNNYMYWEEISHRAPSPKQEGMDTGQGLNCTIFPSF